MSGYLVPFPDPNSQIKNVQKGLLEGEDGFEFGLTALNDIREGIILGDLLRSRRFLSVSFSARSLI